jgi:cytochrome c-type biogenesis protein CcmH
MRIDRRAFLGGLAAWRLGGPPFGRAAEAPSRRANEPPAQDPLAGQGEAGQLRDPVSAGRSRERITDRDNDPFVTGVEKRLRCTCGCGLDIYTCRTTDFTCTYSPQLHKEVLALQDQGKTAEEIVAAFVAKYGEKTLMAPKPEGFNLAGYVVPGLAVLLVGGVMFAVLRRRARMAQVARAAEGAGEPARPREVAAAVPAGTQASAEELERLERELRELDQ